MPSIEPRYSLERRLLRLARHQARVQAEGNLEAASECVEAQLLRAALLLGAAGRGDGVQGLEIGDAGRVRVVARGRDSRRERRERDDRNNPQASAHRAAGNLTQTHASSPGNVAPLCHSGPCPTRKRRNLC
jgi:hypothetical protein